MPANQIQGHSYPIGAYFPITQWSLILNTLLMLITINSVATLNLYYRPLHHTN